LEEGGGEGGGGENSEVVGISQERMTVVRIKGGREEEERGLFSDRSADQSSPYLF